MSNLWSELNLDELFKAGRVFIALADSFRRLANPPELDGPTEAVAAYTGAQQKLSEVVFELLENRFEYVRDSLKLEAKGPHPWNNPHAMLVIAKGIKFQVRALRETRPELITKVRKKMNGNITVQKGYMDGSFNWFLNGTQQSRFISPVVLSQHEVGEGREILISALQARVAKERTKVASYLAFIASPPAFTLDKDGSGTLDYNGKSLEVQGGHITINVVSKIDLPIIEDSAWAYPDAIGGLTGEKAQAVIDDAALIRVVELNALNDRLPLARSIEIAGAEASRNLDISLWIIFDWSVMLFQVTDPQASGKMLDLRKQLIDRIEAQGGAPSRDGKKMLAPQSLADMNPNRGWRQLWYCISFNDKRRRSDLPHEPLELQIEWVDSDLPVKPEAKGWNALVADLRHSLAEMVGIGDLYDLWVERFIS